MDETERQQSRAMASIITLGSAASALLQAIAGDPQYGPTDEQAIIELNDRGLIEQRESRYNVTPRGKDYLTRDSLGV